MARPHLKLDEEQIEELAAINCSMEEIAKIMGCNKSTLYNNYSTVIEKGRARGKSSLKKKMFQVAMQGNVPMLIWLSKIMLEYKEESKKTITVNGETLSEDKIAAMSMEETIALVKSKKTA